MAHGLGHTDNPSIFCPLRLRMGTVTETSAFQQKDKASGVGKLEHALRFPTIACRITECVMPAKSH